MGRAPEWESTPVVGARIISWVSANWKPLVHCALPSLGTGTVVEADPPRQPDDGGGRSALPKLHRSASLPELRRARRAGVEARNHAATDTPLRREDLLARGPL